MPCASEGLLLSANRFSGSLPLINTAVQLDNGTQNPECALGEMHTISLARNYFTGMNDQSDVVFVA